MRTNQLLAAIGIILPILTLTAWGQYAGGSGTDIDPYQISTAAQLQAIGANPLDWDKHFILLNDIDLSAYDGQGGNPEFNRIGTDPDHAYSGTLNGNHHTISNLTLINAAYDYVGLLGSVGNTGIVRQLNLSNVNINVSRSRVGGVAGYSSGQILACTVSGNVTGSYQTGGLIGLCTSNTGEATGCSFFGTVAGDNNTGGLIGYASTAQITNCFSSGSVSGGYYVGGMIGESYSGTVESSYCTNSERSYRRRLQFGEPR